MSAITEETYPGLPMVVSDDYLMDFNALKNFVHRKNE